MFDLRHVGNWVSGQVHTRWTASTHSVSARVQEMIDQAWTAASARPGVNLFDGAMCRLEESRQADDQLELLLSHTSYKMFMGTNLSHPELADTLGSNALANPVGASSVLITADGQVMLGRRNDRVAYYPGRIHPFAGALEPQAPLDVFAEVRRELAEELDIGDDNIQHIACTGMIQDRALRQPELTFFVQTTLLHQQVQHHLKDDEHLSTFSVPVDAQRVLDALRSDQPFTPVATGTLLLWGRLAFGQEWFDQARSAMGIG
jgi:hypothetical protein